MLRLPHWIPAISFCFSMRRYELTDAQWSLIEDLFPKQTTGRPRLSDRQVLGGTLWILCSGAAWRDLPTIVHDRRYGTWQTVYSRFRRWQKSGLFDRILKWPQVELDERGLIDYATQRFLRMMIDSMSIRASRAAAGAPKGAPEKKGASASRWITRSDAPEAV
jgi:transposase